MCKVQSVLKRNICLARQFFLLEKDSKKQPFRRRRASRGNPDVEQSRNRIEESGASLHPDRSFAEENRRSGQFPVKI